MQSTLITSIISIVFRTPVRFFISDAGRERKNLKISFRGWNQLRSTGKIYGILLFHCLSLLTGRFARRRGGLFFSISSHEPLPYRWLFFALTSQVMAQSKIYWLQRWGMAARYKITATIMKPGNPPVLWTRYSGNKMTRTECEHMFSIPKEPGRSFGDKVKVQDFRCVAVENEKVWKYHAVIKMNVIWW